VLSRWQSVVARSEELPDDAGRLRWIRDELPIGHRQRGADVPADLRHEGGTTEHANARLLHEPTKRRDIV
jgi:hypothetical protein